VYSFDPLPANPNEKEKLHILGGQANLWRERVRVSFFWLIMLFLLFCWCMYLQVPDEQRVEYMMFPRASSLGFFYRFFFLFFFFFIAEALWSPKNRLNFDDFVRYFFFFYIKFFFSFSRLMVQVKRYVCFLFYFD
jgi:hypothetical protein